MKEARGSLESKTLLERKMKKSFPMTTWNENPSDTFYVQKYKKSKSMCSKSIFVNCSQSQLKNEFNREKYNFLKDRFKKSVPGSWWQSENQLILFLLKGKR